MTEREYTDTADLVKLRLVKMLLRECEPSLGWENATEYVHERIANLEGLIEVQ